MELYNDDCFNVFPKIEDKSINLFLLDLPYGQTACKWDSVIDLDKMWIEIKRMMKPNGIIIFFCTAKFGNTIINSNPKWFKYDLIWKKSRKVGFLSANKMPLRQHENIYVFKDEVGTYNPQKIEGKEYNKYRPTQNITTIDGAYGKIFKANHEQKVTDRHPTSIIEHENLYVFKKEQGTYNPQKTEGTPYKSKERIEQMEHYNNGEKLKRTATKDTTNRHPTSIIEHENLYVFKKEQGTYNPQKTEGTPYKNGADHNPNNVYGITKEKGTEIKTDRHPTSIIEHENIYVFNDKPVTHSKNEDQEYSTYNPQKTEGKPYKVLGGKSKSVDGSLSRGHEVISKEYTNTGDRHPTSIIENTVLEYNNPAKSLHRTQKPVELCEWLIKTYTNEDDVVMDFTMGSGTTGIACSNTNRDFIGVEMDKEIFEIAEKRILDHLIEQV